MVHGPHFQKGCVRSSHLVVRGNHTYWHPISISTDTESISIAVRYRSNILFIAKDDITHKKKRQNCEKSPTCTHYTYKCAYDIFRMLDLWSLPPTHQPVAEVVHVISGDERGGELMSPVCVKNVELLGGRTRYLIRAEAWRERTWRHKASLHMEGCQ